MRIDKYLKVARVIKRRTIAKDILDFGFVSVNGKNAKPSTDVKIGDEITLKLGERILKIRVTNLANTPKKEESKGLFEIIEDHINEV